MLDRWTNKTSRLARGSAMAVTALASFVWVTTALAETARVSLDSQKDPELISSFTLDFGEFGDIDGQGALRTGLITETDAILEVDADAGSAKLAQYIQHVDPIILPGGFDTGAITVVAVPDSSDGRYFRDTGEFVTEETYAIYFEGDLSVFGLESPVYLPAQSTGVVSFDGQFKGHINSTWEGEGVIGTGENQIPFAYVCLVNNVFGSQADSLLDLKLVPDVTSLELPGQAENDLLLPLDLAFEFQAIGEVRQAARVMQKFNELVAKMNQHPAIIGDQDAADLTATSNAVIDRLLGHRPESGLRSLRSKR